MEITKKIYPYPVLSSFSHCYENSSFDVSVSNEIMSNNSMKIIADYKLENDDLKTLLSENKVCFALHYECSSTGLRNMKSSTDTHIEVILESKSISDKIQICPLLIANDHLCNYTNSDFVSDLRGIQFNNIEKGMVMGVADSFNISITKNKLDFFKTPSVIEFVQNLDRQEKDLILEMNKPKLVIIIPYDVFPFIKNNERNAEIQPLINSSVIVPALVNVLNKIDSIEDRESFESRRWYQALRKALKERFSIDLDSGARIDEYNGGAFLLAQRLIGSPIINGLTYAEKNTEEFEDD